MVFGLIGAYDKIEGASPKSELLGKVYGIRLEAYLNLISENPDYYNDALQASDAAIAEFSSPDDLGRHYQYRCQLLVEAGEVEQAIDYLFRSFGYGKSQSRDYEKIVGMIYKNKGKPAIFSLFHYTNVMRLMAKTGHEDTSRMHDALMSFHAFTEDVESGENTGHPWNLVLWNMSRCYAILGKVVKAEAYYKKAMAITQANPDNVTMYTFSVSMAADHLLYCIRNNLKSRTAAENDYIKASSTLHQHRLPKGIASAFPVLKGQLKESELERIAGNYLK